MERSAEEIAPPSSVRGFPEGPGPVPVVARPRVLAPRPPPMQRLADAVRLEPGRSLLIAACAGFIAGRLIKLAIRRLREL